MKNDMEHPLYRMPGATKMVETHFPSSAKGISGGSAPRTRKQRRQERRASRAPFDGRRIRTALDFPGKALRAVTPAPIWNHFTYDPSSKTAVDPVKMSQQIDANTRALQAEQISDNLLFKSAHNIGFQPTGDDRVDSERFALDVLVPTIRQYPQAFAASLDIPEGQQLIGIDVVDGQDDKGMADGELWLAPRLRDSEGNIVQGEHIDAYSATGVWSSLKEDYRSSANQYADNQIREHLFSAGNVSDAQLNTFTYEVKADPKWNQRLRRATGAPANSTFDRMEPSGDGGAMAVFSAPTGERLYYRLGIAQSQQDQVEHTLRKIEEIKAAQEQAKLNFALEDRSREENQRAIDAYKLMGNAESVANAINISPPGDLGRRAILDRFGLRGQAIAYAVPLNDKTGVRIFYGDTDSSGTRPFVDMTTREGLMTQDEWLGGFREASSDLINRVKADGLNEPTVTDEMAQFMNMLGSQIYHLLDPSVSPNHVANLLFADFVAVNPDLAGRHGKLTIPEYLEDHARARDAGEQSKLESDVTQFLIERTNIGLTIEGDVLRAEYHRQQAEQAEREANGQPQEGIGGEPMVQNGQTGRSPAPEGLPRSRHTLPWQAGIAPPHLLDDLLLGSPPRPGPDHEAVRRELLQTALPGLRNRHETQ